MYRVSDCMSRSGCMRGGRAVSAMMTVTWRLRIFIFYIYPSTNDLLRSSQFSFHKKPRSVPEGSGTSLAGIARLVNKKTEALEQPISKRSSLWRPNVRHANGYHFRPGVRYYQSMSHKHAAGGQISTSNRRLNQGLRQDTKHSAYASIRGLLVVLQHSIHAGVLFKNL
jgi:hypothetical protein